MKRISIILIVCLLFSFTTGITASAQEYSADLRSLTQGRGVFSAEFSRYEEVPYEQQAKIIADAAKNKE